MKRTLTTDDLPALMTGIMATLAAIGIARFAYTQLLPAIIQEGWFTANQGAYLGAANLLGYFIGALAAHSLSERFSPRLVMAASFAGIVLSFVLCAGAGGFLWFFFWRLVSGVAGAILMVVGPSLALAATPPERRTRVGAMVFTGIGFGALLSAFIVPLLLALSLSVTWGTLGLLCVAAGLLCDWGVAHLASPITANPKGNSPSGYAGVKIIVMLVVGAYALDAIGFVPHTVFWVDYLARENALGNQAASLQWGIFGLGALCGPFMVGTLAHRVGWQGGLMIAFAAKAAAVLLPVFSLALLSQSVSSFMVGAMIPGIVALTSGRLAELVGPTAHKKLWGQATAAFAAAQAVAGYAMSALYGSWGSYTPLFAISGLILVAGFLLVLLSRGVQHRHTQRSAQQITKHATQHSTHHGRQ
ncbi:YbfB/YjiJ family MFS transporter [Vreelandella piezotolerans]|uniref:YbfB/YjiJ family MFS transporter n=1 Tax=Vreelandella piezotolerans TaxID=2609667 RepID=A0ABQ6X600_9GAMM|nr:YbfB/YjiJ family MFS transporter [Halomonas piezotolerans]KAE8437448.1 YbfB/YjiJ family MFS transporter [Halomonas piezotolerans]QJA24825.1 YbfB/YjiJ family MFS transporter [Halomonas piezotolerans]